MKISFATFLLINSATAECDFDWENIKFWPGRGEPYTIERVVNKDGTVKFENPTDDMLQFNLPVKSDLTDGVAKCDFNQLHFAN